MPLTVARPLRKRPPFDFKVATGDDDAAVRRLLRAHPLPGRVSLTFEREPDARLAAGIEGDLHQTLVAREERTGAMAGVASRAERVVFVNGRPVRLGYLSQLRVATGVRRLRSLVDEGFAYLRDLHASGGVPAYLVSLSSDNDAARRLLIDRRSPDGPRYRSAGRLTTYMLPAREHAGSGLSRTPGLRRPDLDALADCLQRNLRRFQFAPVWDATTLTNPRRMRGLSLDDFVVVRRGDRVVGCAALWDQRGFKQVVVRGYAPSLRRWRPVINLFAPLIGRPRLPVIGEPLEFAYLSHLAVDDDDPATVAKLLGAVRARAAAVGMSHVVVGVPRDHAFAAVIERLGRHEKYETELFLASWPDGEAFVRSVDGRPPLPEVAIL